ncbi:HpcH/HpaI aldolase/citrate lyase family protein [Streptomyces albipurpureus]|uniref:CoA ester lyase n=1 Tax=Streptomyces albipurpureus TaxID=2897419 RepID=A0ABT0UJ70_9ACTN|nr:CoA ester lyase [Streptomyces sp. CWNU-1]MCM2387341.1 CoA ester lyase [Streptomyces sp. CWNU-1]
MRSALYVPGNAPDKLAKALDLGADELIVDLEDAVPPDGKDAARRTVAEWLCSVRARASPRVWVRINPGETGLADIAAVASGAVAGFCAAKTESVGRLVQLDGALRIPEKELGLAPGSFGLVPLLESAAAVLAAPLLARGPRVVRLQLGEADLRADTGIEPGPDERELQYARSQVVMASAAAGIGPPMGPVSTDFRDLDRLRESTLALRRLGFRGRACIHPAQLGVVHEVFTPSSEELAWARDLIDRYEEARATGAGVCLDARGRLVDAAVVRSAQRVLGRLGVPVPADAS